MSANLFLSPLIPPNKSLFPYSSNPISDSNTLLSHSLNPNPKFTTFSTLDKNGSVKGTNSDYHTSKESFSSHGSGIRSRGTAPWMKGPLVLEPNQVLDLTKPKNRRSSFSKKNEQGDDLLTQKISGARGKKAMKIILQGIDKLQETQVSDETQKRVNQTGFGFQLRESNENEGSMFGEKMPWESDESVLTSPDHTGLQFSLGDSDEGRGSRFREKLPWQGEEKVVFRRMKKEKVVTAAELRLDRTLLQRLRGEAAKMRKWVKVKKAGVTEDVIDQMCSIWRNSELVMVKFDLPLSRNMDRAREIIETKTGGLVVWSKKDIHVAYRGCNYQLPSSKQHILLGRGEVASSDNNYGGNTAYYQVKSKARFVDELLVKEDEEPINGSLYEREADRLLDGLGPRYVDWWMRKPLPVDADLLPEVVSGFKLPPRLSPQYARCKLANDDLTYLRKLARPLPTHFVLGRNQKLQGLAAAILKLWEKCHIAKIAVKWGIPNTDNEQMATELKRLTGGVLLLRNKFYIILYRGKDFLPRGVASLVAEREMELSHFQLQEEAARNKAIGTFYLTDESSANASIIGTLSEFQDHQSLWEDTNVGNSEAEVRIEAEKRKVEKEIRSQEHKLMILKRKIAKASKELTKLNSAWSPSEQDVDQEVLTEEERTCFHRIGLKMDRTLVLGRRGVFDGVIEGIHQHWKHREIVKVVTMQRVLSRIIYTAKLLEAESGGILVSVDKLKEGHAILIYRGKNYRRPLKLSPTNLLTKREALQRSLEMQRLGSLKFFAYQRQKAIFDLKSQLAQLQKGQIN